MFRRNFLKLSSALPFVGLIKDKEEKPNKPDIDCYLNQGWINFYNPSNCLPDKYGFGKNCEIKYGPKIEIVLSDHCMDSSQNIKNYYENKDGDILIGIERLEKCGSKHWYEAFYVFKIRRCECIIEKDYFDISGIMIRGYNLNGIKYSAEQLKKYWIPFIEPWNYQEASISAKQKEEIIKSFRDGKV